MNFDDYAEYITQKFRLSTAIAIIKSKPENLTTEEYINELKNKIDDKMGDELDISICSDDFNADDDNDLMNISETILRDYHFDNNLFEVEYNKSRVEWPRLTIPHTPENVTQTKYYEPQPLNPNPITQANSNPIIDNVVDTDATYCDTIDIENNIPRNTIKGPTNVDSQQTILYTVYGFTQNTHYSPSQNNIIIPRGHIYGNNNICKGIETNNNTTDNTNVINDIQWTRDVNDDISFNNTNDKVIINDNEGISTGPASENLQIVTIINVNDNGRGLTKEADGNNGITDIYSNNSHKTSDNDINYFKNVTNESHITNDWDLINDNSRISNAMTSGNRQNVDMSSDNTNKSNTSNGRAEQRVNSQNIIFSQQFDENYNENSINPDNTELNQFNLAYNTKLNYFHNIENNDKTIISKAADQTIESSQNTDIFSQNDEIFNENNECHDRDSNEMTSNTKREMNKEKNDNKQIITIEATHEMIPFKILEEFNKVKGFLCRNERRMSMDGYSTDSGYKSDSQSRSNKSALQLSGNWLNQSGHCLFNYVMSGHLVVTTRDITNEIAQVLGQLIDKLHEEEKYPSFLEALLEANDLLLKQLYEAENSSDNVLLNRDENIQRLILLNKSVHLQKFCIEKITNILTDYHRKITDKESIIELTDIDGIENLYYIFHILEILLKKYNKNKDFLSQASTQPSQDEGIFKKSSITDLWKRKWNPNYQDGGTQSNSEKSCVVQLCCEILNKIIVDCLNSYSLVSYAALKCFNLTQS